MGQKELPAVLCAEHFHFVNSFYGVFLTGPDYTIRGLSTSPMLGSSTVTQFCWL